MEEKGSTLVQILAVALCLTAFGFAIAAERRRSTVTDRPPFLFFLPLYALFPRSLFGVGCQCLGLLDGMLIRLLFPLFLYVLLKNSILFARLTFLIAEACLIAGATKNAYHTKYRHVVYAQSWTCESLRKGVFVAGAVFVVFTMILSVYYYMYFAKATSQAARKTSKPNPTVGMAGYA
ncbi:hypothetical protein GW17_00038606 [Ensete ventricosum]|uniref:Uncharacterized protein n=1 Tax=Ensete ventricosum TaxID=4639 RepID=A0A444DK66_ENSVE|nr:hypothetical protein GW17_00038606 [Ensete ventricosum]RZR71222.1 hypothetical protein BHM03_00004195 [Ensete ventricosum]